MTSHHSSIVFRLNSRSDRAPFRQLVDQVVNAVERGQLRGGDQLPSVREVVRQITINPNTVHRAYRELEYLGLAEGRPGLGTFVKASEDLSDSGYRANSWRDVLQEGVEMARSSGIPDNEIIQNVQSLLSSESEARS
ncbi:MAG TPA: GntR family transcriptional regulator [Acidimicrobiales bacterium]